MNSNTIAINVDNISKCYRLGVKDEMSDTFGATVINFLKSPLKNYRKYRSLYKFDDVDPDNEHEFSDILWALKNVSFDVKRGESIGIIGRNGSGKSTMLKVIAKITTPTKGYAQVNGRISSLLEVGTGFHPELTGKENIYLNGTILGMRKKEIDTKLEEIIAFSGVEKFIETPVKRYSSGMRVRLAFSVAAHLEPEILLIDEVLAVGDAEFQKKCLGKMGEVTRQGRTVLFVSHQMAAVEQLCHRVIWLNQGSVVSSGPSTEIISKYLNDGPANKIGPGGDLSAIPREPNLEPIIVGGTINQEPFQEHHFVNPLKPLRVELELKIPRSFMRCNFAINFKNIKEECIYSVNTRWVMGKIDLKEKGSYKIVCEVDELPLAPNTYQLFLVARSNNDIIDRLEKVVTIEVARDDVYGTGELPDKFQGYFLSKAQWDISKGKIKQITNQFIGKQIAHILHIGKTGGSVVKEALKPYLLAGKFKIELHDHSFRLKDVPEGEKVVFFLRDPIKRFISGFYSRKRKGQPRYNFPWSPGEEGAFRHFKTPNALASALSSKNKRLKERAVMAMKNITHVNTSYCDWFDSETYFLYRFSDILFIKEYSICLKILSFPMMTLLRIGILFILILILTQKQ